jgi:RimJ/RimL family protein N-acetyltransferase
MERFPLPARFSARSLEGRLCRLRPYHIGDASALAAIADDFLVARWMTNRFPHPYTPAEAERWIAHAIGGSGGTHRAIEVGGHLAGGIGFEPIAGDTHTTALFGYWLGRAYWGRGIGTDAVQTLSGYALTRGGMLRLEASVFVENVASARVLEKCGFSLEAKLPNAYLDRAGVPCDALLYVRSFDSAQDDTVVPRMTRL